MEQRTDEWFSARAGKVTASMVYAVAAKGRNGQYYKAREDYLNKLLCERLTNSPSESVNSRSLQHGRDLEPKARAIYIIETGNDVSEIGFIQHPEITGSGASPDGLVYPDGLVEIKCPTTAVHIGFLKNSKPKDEYFYQMQWQMACTGRKWCDFVSYDDRLPEHLSYKCIRINRDDDLIQEIETEVVSFLGELEQQIKELEEKC
ncbi:exonuclease [Neisseria arctica]|uniref:Exonuclease n=1 Tax=Neisseria arctica TaxID=1470200 RepID=A0A0J0YT51_9NEIS|nr:lambda exonuclease family protein [Neisseria arctica]KLT73282.1 exonuclease [Neisseria arctica]UOO87457.1 YqaJ viral recombinase family protein [Neisseria arctica]